MTLHDQIKADALAIITGGGFEETAMYKPYQGTPRLINVLVNRNPPSKLSETNSNMAADIQVDIANDATAGTAAINLHKDKITLSERYGGTAKDYTLTKIIYQDEGSWLVEVR